MWYSPLMTQRGHRIATGVLVFLAVTVFIGFFGGASKASSYLSTPENKETTQNNGPPPLQYLPEPDWKAPPVKDPFAVFGEHGAIPPVPKWNRLPDNIATKHGFDYRPPLMIGFTRTWPILIQCVVSYIAAGWPASEIYVIENTGVQRANQKGELTLQHPYYLGYKALKRLGVNVVRTPALLSFAQLQSFYTSLAHENNWPYYFWSHSDVLALSYEQGKENVTPAYDQDGYQNIYAVALMQLRKYIDEPDNHWAQILYAYDHLAAVDRDKFDKVGGFDPFIPFYMNDCDFHHRIRMANFSQQDSTAGMIYDVAAVVDDLRVLFREPGAARTVTDPNPDAPKKETKRTPEGVDAIKPEALSEKDYFKQLMGIGDQLFQMKHRDNDKGGRNTWQASQQGGQGEPFYYPARGIAESIELMTELGREVFRRKWGHRDCDLHTTRLEATDMWRVKKDW